MTIIMMSVDVYLTYIAASLVLILMPGPNVAFIVANSLAYGARYGLLTVAGTASAMLLQLLLTLLGMGFLLALLAEWFEWLRWTGVAYLIYLGIRTWSAPLEDLTQVSPLPLRHAIFTKGFLISLANPKTFLFFGAFLPQFVTMTADPIPQMAVLSATFLIMATFFDSAWALLAHYFHDFLRINGKLRNRITSILLVGAAIGLALARIT